MPPTRRALFALPAGALLAASLVIGAACSKEAPTEETSRATVTTESRWRALVPAPGLKSGLVSSRDHVFLTAGPRLMLVDASSGRVVGEFRDPSGDMLSLATVVDDQLAVVTDSRFVFGVERSGRELWRYEFGPSTLNTEKFPNQPCLVAPDGTILAAGPDGDVHAIDRSGTRLWRAHVGSYSAGQPALPLATTADFLLLDTRLLPTDRASLVAVDLRDGNKLRFSLDLGIDVSGLVAGGRAGIVATSYTETQSSRGASKLVSLDERGQERWVIDRGRHEAVYAVSPAGEVVTVSQNADGPDPGFILEKWSPDGEPMYQQRLDMPVVAVLLGSDDVLYAVGCHDQDAVVLSYRADLTPAAPLAVAADCPQSATLDDRGRLFLLGNKPRGTADEPSVELTELQTSSPSAAHGWAVPRARASGSGVFSLAH